MRAPWLRGQQQVLQLLSQLQLLVQQLLPQQLLPLQPPHMNRSRRMIIIQKQPPLLFPQNML